MPSPRPSSRLPALPAFALCAAVWTAALAVPAQAQTAAPAAARADAKADPRADAKSGPGAAPQPDPKADPLERLRERLSRQLGATEAAKGGSNAPTVMRVENPAPGELRLQATPGAPRPPGAARPAAGAGGSQAGAAWASTTASVSGSRSEPLARIR